MLPTGSKSQQDKKIAWLCLPFALLLTGWIVWRSMRPAEPRAEGFSQALPATPANEPTTDRPEKVPPETGDVPPISVAAVKPSAMSTNVAEVALAKVTSLSFDRQSLNEAVERLHRRIGVPIVFDGQSLAIEGITRNQSIHALAEENKSAREILETILAKADRTGKLCYCITEKDGKSVVTITTINGVRKNRWTLPSEDANKP